jgi:hypothetical protein
MEQHRNRSNQIAGAPALGDQKPEQHPKRGRAPFRGRPSARPTALHDELAQTASIPSTRLVAHAFEQRADVDAVIGERAVAGPALLLHPLAETNEHRRQRSHPIVTRVGTARPASARCRKNRRALPRMCTRNVTEWTTSLRVALSSMANMTIKAVENRFDRSVEGYVTIMRGRRKALPHRMRDQRTRPASAPPNNWLRIKQASGRLGQAARRHRRRHRAARSAPPSCARAQMWTAQLADETPDRLARRRGLEVELTGLGRPLVVAGFALSISGRFSAVHRGARSTTSGTRSVRIRRGSEIAY